MSVESLNSNKDVRHVTLAMTVQQVEAYSTTGWDLGDKVLRQPPGIDVVWYPRAPNSTTVSATFFASPLNPDPLYRKSGEDIDHELANLPVISDQANPEGKITHPYLKIDTILQNPQLDYNKGELDFLRSKPVRTHTQWKRKSEIDQINGEFIRQQKLMGEPDDKIKLLKTDESKAEINPETGEKWYPFTIAQVTKGADKEHHGAQDPTKDGATDTAFAVPEHDQEVTNSFQTTIRKYNGAKRHLLRSLNIGAKSNKEVLRL